MKREKNKKINLKKEYSQCWQFIKESKKFIFWIIGIFLIFSIMGYFISPPEIINNQIMNFLENLIEKTSNMSYLELNVFIFWNNLRASFFGLISGIFLGIYPIIMGITNGYLLGFVSSISVQSSGLATLLDIIPHGIFELPALFLSLSLGVKLGLWLIIEPIKFYWKKQKIISLLFILFYLPTLLITLMTNKEFEKKMTISLNNCRRNSKKSLVIFLLIIIPLLLIASIIETLLISLIS